MVDAEFENEYDVPTSEWTISFHQFIQIIA